ncbi:MAG TPA: glycosyltransferase family 61 protein, partial [Paracoccus sp.]|nr:glycosyltransferase family 61 protein [Paracoccus sp. (in: a-proteobacteria)]
RPVFLKRGAGGVARPIAGEDALCERLAVAGYDIVDLAATDFRERYRRLSAASVVVTIDGSHVNHAFYAMRAGAGVVSLIPADRFTMRERGVAHGFGLNYGCVVMQPSEGGYVADPEEILRTVDLF